MSADQAPRPSGSPTPRGPKRSRRTALVAAGVVAALVVVALVALALTRPTAPDPAGDPPGIPSDPAEVAGDADAPIGDVLWRADYDTVTTDEDILGGDRVWHREQEPAVDGETQEDRIRVVPADDVPSSSDASAPEGNAMRVELRPYDGGDGDVTDTNGYLANRSEVLDRQPSTTDADPDLWPDPPGSTRWYDFTVHLDEDWQFAEDGEWLIVVQWKGRDEGSPAVALELEGDEWVLGGTGGRKTLDEAVRGEWVHFQVGHHFSADPDEGWSEVWMDGEQVLERTERATLETDDGEVDPAYLKQGIYRGGGWGDVTHVAHFGPLTVATERLPTERS